jgi:tyrocidine synthetase-3
LIGKIGSNLFDALVKSSTGNNGITFVDNNGDYFLSYNELYKKSVGIAGSLKGKINPADNEIIILLDKNREFVPVFWACIAAGIKAVPVGVGNSDEHKLKLFNIWDSLISPYIVTNRTIFENIKAFAEQNGLKRTFDEIKYKIIYYEDIYDTHTYSYEIIEENDIAFIQFSSGSTGLPKGVILSHKNLLITISADIRRSEINSDDSFLSWFPLTHDMGLIGWHLAPLVADINQVLIETSLFVRRPALWMDKTSEHKSTILCTPNFGLKHFISFTKKLDNADWDLSKVRIVANGAEPISPKLCESFLNALMPYGLKHTTMTPGYGLAEIGLIASMSDYKTNYETIHLDRTKLNIGEKISETNESSTDCLSFVCEGEFIPEMEVKITDNDGTRLLEEHTGHILLKGESVTIGYYNNSTATKRAIKNGWLDTGDLGFLKNNKLYLTGRSKELIIINGYNYYPHDIERVCLVIEELDLGKIVAAGAYEESLDQEALLIFVYFKSTLEKFIELSLKIKEIVLKSVGLNVYKVIPVKKIPKTTSGKVQRFVLLENYKRGEFNDVLSKYDSIRNVILDIKLNDEITQEFVVNKLKVLVNKVINTSNINADEALVNYGIDSIRGNELLGKLKDTFKIEFDEFIYLPDLSLSAAGEIILKNIWQKKLYNDHNELKILSELPPAKFQAAAGQFSIYYHYKNHPLSTAYNISIACRILSNVNINMLNQTYNYVLNRHEILRSKYFMADKLFYKVDEKVNKNIEVIKTDALSYENLKILVRKNAEAPFDIENDSVIKSFLYKTKNHGLIFLVSLHHIAGDARSLFILLNEILTCYNELTKYGIIKSLTLDSEYKYSEYVNEEIKYLNSNLIEIAKEYWIENLSGADFGLNLSAVGKEDKKNEASSVLFEIDRKENRQLKNVSDFTFLLSVYCFILHGYTRQKEIIVGIPVSDNNVISNEKMREGLIGYTIHTLPIKSIFNNSETVSEYLERMKHTILNAMKYQHYPLEKITEDINPSRDNYDGLLHTMFTALPLNSTNKLTALADSLNDGNDIEFGELMLKPFYIPQQESLFDLSMEIVQRNDKIIFRISYNCAKYDKMFVERFACNYKKAVNEFESSFSKKLSSIDILTNEEQLLLESFNNTGKEYQNNRPIIRLIEEQSAKTPERIAYIYGGKKFTYKWLNDKANGLGVQILKLGIKKGYFIPLFMKKGIELPISILAVMKTGCAFIPLDVDTPQRRLNVLINDINPKIILTTKEHIEKLSFVDSSKIIILEIENIKDVKENPDIDISLDDAIYGIYTSGTTGIPKCAVNLHRGITNRFKYMDDYFGTDEQRIVYHSANYIFDTSVYQLFWPLTQGAKVVIPESSEKLNLDSMLDLIEKYQVRYIDLVPSIFNILVEYFENYPEAENKFRFITHLSIGGESIVPEFINKFRKHFSNVKITNIYGPTETAIGVTFYDVKVENGEIPIGKPISNIRIYILDENMNRMPVGITGEIFIGGECIGAGYLNDPYKTATVFVDNPFTGIGKLYKSGDLGCYLTDGNILFKGRADEQVKVRGVRIEPDEIRANIIKIDFVQDAVVVAIEKNNGETQLAAYVVYKNGNYSNDELKKELLKYLPEIFIPQYIIKIDEVPLTPNGKINKRALPEINNDFVGIKENNTVNSLKLLDIWREVLGREDININDRFFDCGGNSLKALLLKIKIQQGYGIELSIEKILNNPSISQLDEVLAKITPEEKKQIHKVELRGYYPISNQQKRMWLLCNGKNASKAYSMIGVFHITGKVDLPVLRKSFEMLVERHESLRTIYKVIHGEPVQVVENTCMLDYKDIHTGNIESELKNILESEKKYSFDLSKLPLFKIITICDDKSNTKLVLQFHHIITDGWSTKIMIQELGGNYNSLIKGETYELEELPFQYKDYSIWFAGEMESKNLKEAEEYWNKKLSGELPVTLMPTDYEKSNLQNRTAVLNRFFICKDAAEKTYQFCKEKEITLFMLLISAVEIVLSKYLNSEEIILGIPISGRNYPGLEQQTGLYVNTVVLKNNVQKDKSYHEFINELKNEILESYKYQDYPYDKLVETKEGNNHSNLFEVFVSHEGLEDEIKLELNETKNNYQEIENRESKFNISVMFREKTGGIELVIEYAKELYKEERIKLFAAHIEKAIEEIIDGQHKKIKSINLLNKAEETKLFKYASTYIKTETKWKSIIEQFECTVKENENNIAVFHQGKSLTYKQLDIDSEKVASVLTAKGIKEENTVGILTTKSIDMIVAMIGILKAGAAYMPLDPGNPINRLQNIVKDSGCKVILTNVEGYCQDIFDCELLELSTIMSVAEGAEISVRVIEPSQLAYVIYTSGSTGTPKGVMIEHHSLSNLINSLRDEVYDHYGKRLNVALQASYVFDASIQQIFPSLMRGDELHLIDDETKLDGKLTADYFEKHEIDIADATPALFDLQLRSSFGNHNCPSLKHLLIGGEPLNYELLKRYFNGGRNESVKITNMYGPTECCVDTTCFTITKDDCNETGIAPIGRPMINTRAYILDENLQLVPEGITGELYLEGENVGRGYINNDELTKTKFIQSTFSKKKRMYRTGDLCRFSYDGSIIYQGRIDNQIKIRGYRVELSEIENVIEHFVEHSKCIVIFDKDKNELVAFLEKRNNTNLLPDSLSEKIRSQLPAYMCPTKIIEIDKIPLTSSGKPDRNKLAANVKNYKGISFNKNYEEPRNDTEKKLTEIWKDILKVEDIGINDNFFELGGHSLKSLKVMSAVAKTFEIEVSYKDILTKTTIKEFAEVIDQIETTTYIPIPNIEEKEYYEISHAQKRIWLECELNNSAAYNIVGGFRLLGELDVVLLNRSFRDLFDRHESLRTKFRIVNGEPKQFICESAETIVNYTDLSFLVNAEEILQKEINDAVAKSLNIFTDDLVHIRLIKTKEKEYFFLALVHHIVTDGWSIKIMLEELGRIYNGYKNGIKTELRELSIQYKDYSAWFEKVIESPRFIKAKHYWDKKIAGKLPHISIPTDHKQAETGNRKGDVERFILNKELSYAIHEYTSSKEVTAFIFMLSIMEIVLSKYTNSDEIILGTPVSGRNHPDLERQLGLYINTIVLRNKIQRDKKYSKILIDLKNEVLESYNYQDYPFDKIMGERKTRNNAGLFNVFVSYETIEDEIKLNLDGITGKYIEIDTCTSKFDISLTFRERKELIELIIEYSTGLYNKDSIDKLGENIIKVAASVINDDEQLISKLSISNEKEPEKTDQISEPAKKIKKIVNVNKYLAPKSSIEKEIAGLWKDILSIKRAGLNDNFFDLGGQSIKALQLVTLFREKYNVNLELKFVFSNQTIVEQAKEIENIIWISNADEKDNREEIVI